MKDNLRTITEATVASSISLSLSLLVPFATSLSLALSIAATPSRDSFPLHNHSDGFLGILVLLTAIFGPVGSRLFPVPGQVRYPQIYPALLTMIRFAWFLDNYSMHSELIWKLIVRRPPSHVFHGLGQE